jgi:hypothetical protein
VKNVKERTSPKGVRQIGRVFHCGGLSLMVLKCRARASCEGKTDRRLWTADCWSWRSLDTHVVVMLVIKEMSQLVDIIGNERDLVRIELILKRVRDQVLAATGELRHFFTDCRHKSPP